MTSFFDKLEVKLNGGKPKPVATGLPAAFARGPAQNVLSTATPPKAAAPVNEEELLNSQKLEVDIYQEPARLVIFALAAGVDPDAFDVVLDEENDLLTIRGVRKRPEVPQMGDKKEDGKFVQQECSWEPFFRKVVLPTEVDPVKASAVFKKGVLMITLPILNVAEGRKLVVNEVLTKPA